MMESMHALEIWNFCPNVYSKSSRTLKYPYSLIMDREGGVLTVLNGLNRREVIVINFGVICITFIVNYWVWLHRIDL